MRLGELLPCRPEPLRCLRPYPFEEGTIEGEWLAARFAGGQSSCRFDAIMTDSPLLEMSPRTTLKVALSQTRASSVSTVSLRHTGTCDCLVSFNVSVSSMTFLLSMSTDVSSTIFSSQSCHYAAAAGRSRHRSHGSIFRVPTVVSSMSGKLWRLRLSCSTTIVGVFFEIT
jgi:hypothetical protein